VAAAVALVWPVAGSELGALAAVETASVATARRVKQIPALVEVLGAAPVALVWGAPAVRGELLSGTVSHNGGTMTTTRFDISSIAIAVLLGANIATGALWLAQRTDTEKVRVEIAQLKGRAAADVATAHRENARELSRLVQMNTEVQRAYNLAQTDLAAMARSRAQSAGLRESERAAIIAAAERATAGALRGYANTAERHIAGIEADATEMGQRAVGAAAAAHALRATIDARREALKAKRDALKSTRPE
jgi:hypothetical protein